MKIILANYTTLKNATSMFVNKSVKLVMKWNGRVYEGRMAGMDFVSNGPKISITRASSRG